MTQPRTEERDHDSRSAGLILWVWRSPLSVVVTALPGRAADVVGQRRGHGHRDVGRRA